MGMDIYSEQGVIADIDDMIGMLRKKDIKEVISVLTEFFDEVDPSKLWTQSDKSFEEFFEPLKALLQEAKPTLEQVTAALRSCCKVNGEPSKYGSDDCYVHWDDALLDIWGRVLGATRPELPDLNEIRVFDSGRVNGWDVPHGIACFIFSDNECYEKVLTETGKALKKAIGHCNSCEWTVMSV